MSDGLFREEALRHHTGGRAVGDVLRIPPAWVRSTFALLVLAFAAAAAFATWGSVTVYARGVARVREDGRALDCYFAERDRARIGPGGPIRLHDPSDPARVLEARIEALRPGPVPLREALARLQISAWPGPVAPSRLAAGDGEIASGSATGGEILTIEAPAGETSLLRLILPHG